MNCLACGRLLPEPKLRGRKRLYCDATCRSRARRQRAVKVALTDLARKVTVDDMTTSGNLMEAATRVESAGGLDGVVAARELHRLTELAMRRAVDRARAAGATWQDIGEALGASKQAAFQRFGRAPETGADPKAADRAIAVLLDLVERRFARVLSLFNDNMAAVVPGSRLEEVRQRVADMVGDYRGMGEPFVHRAGDLTVVRVPLRFEAGELAGEVAFDGDGKIAGLLVRPPQAL
jgi:Protein of unknown function (DUF3887)/Bacterial fructose-1,6-bisphosphatase, glpX-encoded